MWGYISAESSWQTNFNTGFSSSRSDVLLHLSQWQYWWWFWFAFLWAFYLLVINKAVRSRTLKMRPKYTTSYRPHGKWGDFLACAIPVSWCVNILINSNFILRLIEWQNESSLFTIRVRGRQWYWVYKFELKNFTDILSTPKNIGSNKWLINVFGDLQESEDYHHILQLRAQNRWVKNYWVDTIKKGATLNKNHIVLPQEQLRFDLFETCNNSLSVNNDLSFSANYSVLPHPFNAVASSLSAQKQVWSAADTDFFGTNDIKEYSSLVLDSTKKEHSQNFSNFFFFLQNTNFSNNNFVIANTDIADMSLAAKRSSGPISPLRLIKNPLLSDSFGSDLSENNTELFRLRFNDDSTSVQHKVLPHTTYLTIKQKRYKRKKAIADTKKFYHDENEGKTKRVKFSYKPLLINNSIFEDITNKSETYNPTRQYRMLKKNKSRSEVFSVVTNRRMLRTKRTLVIPAHVNITVISNSYDVVHSWWIPGLGIKIDCVPGRSTHHTFFVDNVGFYYGQCAEICGRYHHHMPIRICALPFEHFLVWWYSFGLPRLLFTKSKRRIETVYGFRKYVW